MKKVSNLIQVEMCITSKCNLHCKHCYQNDEKNTYILDIHSILQVIDYANSKNCERYVISGGEMFTHPNVYDILEYILYNTHSNITCVTNLMLIDVEKICKYPRDRIDFKVSIDGDKEVHNNRRGIGAYEKVYNNIKVLEDEGFRVGITMTLVEDNINSIPQILNDPLFKEITFMPVATVGAACEFYAKPKDSPEYNQTIGHIYRTCREYQDEKHRCILFPKSFSIKYTGEIFPCSLSRDYGLCKIGDLNNGSITTQIEAFVNSLESNQFFAYLNNGQILECNNCGKNKECPRGCRIRAYKCNGSLLSPDPFACKIFQGKYADITYGDIYWGAMEKK